MIDTIVFDFGGVLLDWNPKYVYEKLFDNNEEMDWFLTNVCTNEWNLEQDRGRSFKEGISILCELYPDHVNNIEIFHSQWPEMLKGEIAGSVKILKRLKESFKLYGFTNWSAETFPIAYERFDFFKLFDGIVVSGTERMIKPDLAFFQLLLDRYKLNANSCLFIDDNFQNIESARNLGFNTFHFDSAEGLQQYLNDLNLL